MVRVYEAVEDVILTLAGRHHYLGILAHVILSFEQDLDDVEVTVVASIKKAGEAVNDLFGGLAAVNFINELGGLRGYKLRIAQYNAVEVV